MYAQGNTANTQNILMEHLFNEFNPATAAEWKERLEKDLKGITFEDLSIKDRNGITVHPFYTQEDLKNTPEVVSHTPDWAICEHIIVEDAETANYQALAALNSGASGLFFSLNEEGIEPSVLLKDIQLPYIYVYFQVGLVSQQFYDKLELYIQSNNWDISTMNCFLNAEFRIPDDEQEREADTLQLTLKLPLLNQLSIDIRTYQNAGANSVTELAIALSKLKMSLDIIAATDNLEKLHKIHFSVSTDTHFFEQIAKLRALRNLVSLLCQQYDLNISLHIHVEASRIYRSPFDSYSNLLRDTIAGMAGVIGGCDSLYIPPFDEPLRPENKFSKRMSRNQQLIFKEESYLNKVADIGAGSFYIETLTEQIAEKAWEAFKTIEKEGGLITLLNNGNLQKTIQEQAQQLIQEYKDGKRTLIGVNKFPDQADLPQSLPKETFEYKGIVPIYLFREII